MCPAYNGEAKAKAKAKAIAPTDNVQSDMQMFFSKKLVFTGKVSE